MSLFDQSLVRIYTEQLRIGKSDVLNGRYLLTKDDIMRYLRIEDHVMVKYICKTMAQSYALLNGFIEIELIHALSNNDAYNIAFIVNVVRFEDSDDPIVSLSQLNARIESIQGFIIAKKPYCEAKRNAYALDLICVKPSSNGGSILIGLYLYCIIIQYKNGRAEAFGFLDVFDSYTNLSALCLYSKFGFTVDKTLYTGDPPCFTEYALLAMSVDLSEVNENTILRIVNKLEGYAKPRICTVRRELQFIIGSLENLKMLIEGFEAKRISPESKMQYATRFAHIFDATEFDYGNIYITSRNVFSAVLHIDPELSRGAITKRKVQLLKLRIDQLLHIYYMDKSELTHEDELMYQFFFDVFTSYLDGGR